MIYLDANATAPVLPCAAQAVAEGLAAPAVGNPSSLHSFGRAARARLEESREAVAALCGASPAEVVFTSGGTEAVALAIHGLSHGQEGPVLISAIEHACVSASAGARRETVPVLPSGCLDLNALAERLARPPRPALVAVMLANNETGVIQPIAEVAALTAEAGVPLLCDAVQGAGKLPLALSPLPGVSALALSAHKMGGPQGVGAVILRTSAPLPPLLPGGGQERGRRGGTPNLPGILGFAAAARHWQGGDTLARTAARLAELQQRLEHGVRQLSPAVVIHGESAPRLPTTTCFGIPGLGQQRLLMALDLAGVAVSAGSACSSGKIDPSAVLLAMGCSPQTAREAVRASLSWASTAEDVDGFLAALAGVIGA